MRLDVICFNMLKPFASLCFEVLEAGRRHIKMHFLVFPAIGLNVLLIYQIRRTGFKVRENDPAYFTNKIFELFFIWQAIVNGQLFLQMTFFLPLSEENTANYGLLPTTVLKKDPAF